MNQMGTTAELKTPLSLVRLYAEKMPLSGTIGAAPCVP
jgi:hypothetical protein